MKMVLLVVLAALVPVSACGQPLDKTSRHLEALMDDDPWPPGDRCFFTTNDNAPDNYARFMSRGEEGVVRVQGRPVILSYEGDNVRGGGTFRRGTLSVTIGGIPDGAAKSSARIAEVAVVTVHDTGIEEKFEALWNC